MTIAIATDTNVATVEEAESVFGRIMDGMLGAITGKNLTSSEAFWAAAGYTTVGLGVGSVYARKRVNQPPFLGIFF